MAIGKPLRGAGSGRWRLGKPGDIDTVLACAPPTAPARRSGTLVPHTLQAQKKATGRDACWAPGDTIDFTVEISGGHAATGNTKNRLLSIPVLAGSGTWIAQTMWNIGVSAHMSISPFF